MRPVQPLVETYVHLTGSGAWTVYKGSGHILERKCVRWKQRQMAETETRQICSDRGLLIEAGRQTDRQVD